MQDGLDQRSLEGKRLALVWRLISDALQVGSRRFICRGHGPPVELVHHHCLEWRRLDGRLFAAPS